MSKYINEIGKRYGRLVVFGRGENDKFGKAQWICKCDCGNIKIIAGASLRRGLTTSCGCNAIEQMKKYNQSKEVNEIGNRYGCLTVLARDTDVTNQRDGRAMWLCQCSCGNTCIVPGKLLRSGHTGSCGCNVKSLGEIAVENLLIENNIKFSPQYPVYISQSIYDCKQIHPYYFDFAVLDNNNIVQYIIEYDGQQHFAYKNNNTFWNNQENFEQTKMRDAIKNEYCKTKHIPLIRIPYTHLKDLCIDDLKLETTQYLIN